jgi:hypothetical protein
MCALHKVVQQPILASGPEWSNTMKKLGIILAAILMGGLSFSAASLAQENGIYHQDRLPDGTVTGPLGPEVNGG